jgi:hypothetical protein
LQGYFLFWFDFGFLRLWISLSRCLGAFYVFFVENSFKMGFLAKKPKLFFFDDSGHLLSSFSREKRKIKQTMDHPPL